MIHLFTRMVGHNHFLDIFVIELRLVKVRELVWYLQEMRMLEMDESVLSSGCIWHCFLARNLIYEVQIQSST